MSVHHTVGSSSVVYPSSKMMMRDSVRNCSIDTDWTTTYQQAEYMLLPFDTQQLYHRVKELDSRPIPFVSGTITTTTNNNNNTNNQEETVVVGHNHDVPVLPHDIQQHVDIPRKSWRRDFRWVPPATAALAVTRSTRPSLMVVSF